MKNPALLPQFEELKKVLAAHVPPLVAKVDQAEHYEVYSTKKVVVNGRKFDGMYFGAVVVQKDFVGFYFMPIYMNDSIILPEKLKKLLKGKACFHIKKIDSELLKDLVEMTKAGYECFEKMGYFG